MSKTLKQDELYSWEELTSLFLSWRSLKSKSLYCVWSGGRQVPPTQSFYQYSFMQLKNQCEWNCCCCPEDSPSCRPWNFAVCCLCISTTRGTRVPAFGSQQEFILPVAIAYLKHNVHQCCLGQSFSNSFKLLENRSDIFLVFPFYLSGHVLM